MLIKTPVQSKDQDNTLKTDIHSSSYGENEKRLKRDVRAGRSLHYDF